MIRVNYEKCYKDSHDIIGNIVLLYYDILDKKHEERVKIYIESKYNDTVNQYIPVLKNIYGKIFK